MLDALIVLTNKVISEVGTWDPAGFNVVPVRAVNPLLTPEEPTTLILAAIGISLIGAYVVTRRIWRSQPTTISISTAKPAKKTKPQQPKRRAG